MIDQQQYLRFCDEALSAMTEMVTALGDDLANRRPDLPGANSPVQILTHCLGVMGHWAGAVNLGRDVPRDRDAEFEAVSRVAELAGDVETAQRQFHADVEASAPAAAPALLDDPALHTQGLVLFHVYEELAQHRGQLELTRDVLVAGSQGA